MYNILVAIKFRLEHEHISLLSNQSSQNVHFSRRQHFLYTNMSVPSNGKSMDLCNVFDSLFGGYLFYFPDLHLASVTLLIFYCIHSEKMHYGLPL